MSTNTTKVSALPFAPRGDGLELAIRATPRARKEGIEGVVLDAAGAAWLAVKVTAPPDAGKANAAVLALLAKALAVPPSALSLFAGAGSRWKRVRASGETAALLARAEALLRPGA